MSNPQYDPVHRETDSIADRNETGGFKYPPYAASSSFHTSPATAMYPPVQLQDHGSQASLAESAGGDRPPRGAGYDEERTHFTRMPEPSARPTSSRNPSWDMLRGKFDGYEQFDSRNASEAHLVFAEGDMPNDKVSKFYSYLLSASIITRWFIFIIPILGIIWIPGILQLTDTTPNGEVWGVQFLWWSIWLSVVWGGWWAALAGARLLPIIIRSTVGVIAIATRRYIDWASALHRYVAFFAWTLAMWISFNPLINARQSKDASEHSVHAIDIIVRLLFGFYLCSAVLLFEKFAIQFIAGKFHERSYAERIADQKFAVRSLVVLYRHSSDIPGRSDTLKASHAKNGSVNPSKILKKAMKGVRSVATTTTTAFGNVASEIAGSSVLQPNSPQAMVKTALESANKTKLLARRLFYSFARPGADFIFPEDIGRFFSTQDEADQVFSLFDKDGNGDASREEVEVACQDFHREQLSIMHSMQDLDSAVGRLDNIFMTVYAVAALLILAVCLEAGLSTVITGAGTFILGLSWLIGAPLADVLTSIVFLFIRHPFDVGDRVVINKDSYMVKEIHLLSTIFLDSQGVFMQVPNSVLNTHFIFNIRRSGQMSEQFTFDVAYGTSFDDLEKLREIMLHFLKTERRDYQPSFDVSVVDFPAQEKMTLSAEIKYKSNGQMEGMKARRRNKWVCALKTSLAQVPIFGPAGDPGGVSGPTKYTKIPWEDVKAEEDKKASEVAQVTKSAPVGGWNLVDENAAMRGSGDIFGEADDAYSTRTPGASRGPSGDSYFPTMASRPPPNRRPTFPTAAPVMPSPLRDPAAYKMTSTRR